MAKSARRQLDPPMRISVRPAGPDHAAWRARFLAPHNSERVARRGELLQPMDHPALVAVSQGRPLALLTYRVEGDEFEVLTLHSEVQGVGAGTALLAAARRASEAAGWRRLWLITTNDNTHAIRFYQRRGFRIATVYPGAVDDARRRLKPDIPLLGNDDIPIRDEIEFELRLGAVM
jgi:ribosomal protein S18 acetylase RimI-like enzyme